MAAQNGTLTLVAKNGRTYLVDVYLPDAAANQITFNPTSGAASGSQVSFRAPEDVNIVDLSIAASPTATALQLQINNAAIVGGVARYANCLNTLPYRIPMRIPVKGGDFIAGLNLT